MSQPFTLGGQSIGASASAMNSQDWFPIGLTGLISLLSKRLLRVFFSTTIWKHQFFGARPSLWSNSHIHVTTRKTIALTIWTFVDKGMSVLFNTLSGFVIDFLPRSRHLWISWLQSLSAVILEPPKRKPLAASTFPPSTCRGMMGLEAIILVFWMLSFKSAFSLSSFTFIRRLFSSSSRSAIRVA